MKRFLWLLLLLPALAFGQTPFNPVAQTVAITAPSGSSSSSTALPGAFAASTLQVYNATSVPITWAYSRVPGGAAASSTSTIVPAGVTEYFYIGTGVFDVAVYGIGGTGTVYLQAGTGGYFQGVGVATIGSVTTGDCAKFVSNVLIQDAGACGGGGSSAFNALTSGTNTTAAMLVGTGASLGPTGSGTLNANQLNGASAPASAPFVYTNSSSQLQPGTVGNGLTCSSGTCSTTQAINAQTATTYTIASTDASKLVTFNNASAVAVTLPQATGSFGAGFAFTAENLGAGTVTITPTTSTINGASTLTIAQNRGCSIVSDGANYQVAACNALISAGSNQQVIPWVVGTISQGTTTYTAPATNGGSGAIGAITTFSGTLKNLYFRAGSAPASGQTFTITLQTGTPGTPSSTSVTCTVQSTSTNNLCSDTTDTASITAGQAWSVQVTTSATSGSTGNSMVAVELDH